MRYLKTMIIFTILFFAANAFGADEGELTLDKCIHIALENNSSVKLSQYSVMSAKEKSGEAFTGFLPKLSAKASYLRYDSVPTAEIEGFGTVPLGTKDNYSLSVDLTQPLFTGGRIKKSYDIARNAYDSAVWEDDLRKKDIVREVTERYFQALKAKKLEEVARNSRDLIQSHLKNVDALFEAGIVSKNDVLSTKVSLSDAESFLIQAKNGYELAKSALNFTLNRDINAEVILTDIGEETAPIEATLEESIERALTNREELKIIENAESINESLIDIERSAYYPQFYFIGSYAEGGDEMPLRDKYHSALFTMELDIFSWGETSHRVESKKIELKKINENKTMLKNSITLEVKSAYLRLKQTLEEINATKQAVDQSEENYRIYNEKFKVNAATSTDVLDAENLILRSKINYFRALYDYHIAKANLKRAMGGK